MTTYMQFSLRCNAMLIAFFLFSFDGCGAWIEDKFIYGYKMTDNHVAYLIYSLLLSIVPVNQKEMTQMQFTMQSMVYWFN